MWRVMYMTSDFRWYAYSYEGQSKFDTLVEAETAARRCRLTHSIVRIEHMHERADIDG